MVSTRPKLISWPRCQQLFLNQNEISMKKHKKHRDIFARDESAWYELTHQQTTRYWTFQLWDLLTKSLWTHGFLSDSFLNIQQITTSWWFQPIRKICQIGSFPQVGIKIKNIWVATTQTSSLLQIFPPVFWLRESINSKSWIQLSSYQGAPKVNLNLGI